MSSRRWVLVASDRAWDSPCSTAARIIGRYFLIVRASLTNAGSLHRAAQASVELLGRLRSDRVLRRPRPSPPPGTPDRPPRHGPEFALNKPATWPDPAHVTVTDTTRYGTATATSWDRLTHRGCWADHDGEPPLIEGTLIRLQVAHLPGDRDPEPVWLWSSRIRATAADVDRW